MIILMLPLSLKKLEAAEFKGVHPVHIHCTSVPC